ncbi:hypothetical protein [Aureispira anguillae]|uniref:Uncharacterized protein n=1 Tax=Aureispira anguillae TaxID=2864201 RepID=A0A916DQE4_9BACT|nr:hypothetical protein [Aureispira anguillae]BDS10045.1 hypothetical protein AsAng_0007500 [Aureispira anguillae]
MNTTNILFAFLLVNICACANLKSIQEENKGAPIIFSKIQAGRTYISPHAAPYIHFSRNARVVGELQKKDKILIYSEVTSSTNPLFKYTLFPYQGDNCRASLGDLKTTLAYLDTSDKESSEVYNHQFEYNSYKNKTTKETLVNFSCARLADAELLHAIDSIRLFHENTPVDSMGIFLKNILIAANIRDRLNSSQNVIEHFEDSSQYIFTCAVYENSTYSGSPMQSSLRRYLHTAVRVTTQQENHLIKLEVDSLYSLSEIHQHIKANYYQQSNNLATDLIGVKCFDPIDNPYYVILYYFKKVNP